MEQLKKILIIDDEVDTCLLMSHFFQRKSCMVYIAHTLDEGIRMLSSLQPDVVFLDNNLPDGLGWNQATTIVSKFPKTRVHLISAYEYGDSASLSGFHIWEKPISMSKLESFLHGN